LLPFSRSAEAAFQQYMSIKGKPTGDLKGKSKPSPPPSPAPNAQPSGTLLKKPHA
jgi:hypothetical protein